MRPSSGHGKDGAAPPARPVVAMRSQQPVSEAASPPAARGRNSATTEGRSDGLTWAPRYHFVAPPSTRPDTAPSYNPPAAPPFALVNRSTASGATGARVGIPGPVPSSSMLQSRVATRFSGDGLNPAALGAPASASPTPRSRSMPMHHERVATPGATGTSGSRGAGLSTVGGHSRPWALPSPKGILKKSQQVPLSRSAEVGSTPLGVATSPRRVRFNEGSLMDSGMGASHVYSDDALGMSLDHVNLEEVMQERDSSLVTSSKLVAATGQWGEDSEWFNAQFGVSSPPKSAPVSTTKSAGRSVASSSGAPRSQPPNGGQLPSPSKSGSGGGSLKESSSSYVDGLTESERRFIKTLILVNQRRTGSSHSMRSGSSASSREPSMSTSSPVLPHGPGMNTSLLEDNWSTSRPASGGAGARRHSYQSGESSLERTRNVTVPRSSTSNGTRGTDSVAIRGSTSTVEPSVLIMTPRGTYLGDEAAPLAEVRRSTQSRMLSSASSLEEEGPRRQVPQPFPHGGR